MNLVKICKYAEASISMINKPVFFRSTLSAPPQRLKSLKTEFNNNANLLQHKEKEIMIKSTVLRRIYSIVQVQLKKVNRFQRINMKLVFTSQKHLCLFILVSWLCWLSSAALQSA